MRLPRVWLKATLASALATLLLTGCSYQDFKKPLVRNYAADLFYRPERPMGEEGVAVDTEALAAALARWKRQYPAEEIPYKVGKRDVLRIVINVTGGAESSALEVPVAEDGTITTPLIGGVQVLGLTSKEIENLLAERYQGDYYRNAVVNVYVMRYESQTFYVTGAVMKPGVVPLTRPRLSLLEALMSSGGPSLDAGDSVVVTRGTSAQQAPGPKAGESEAPAPTPPPASAAPPPVQVAPESIRVSLRELIELSDMSRNIWIGPGDVVHVPPATPNTFLVLGYVNGPGMYTLPRGEKLGLLDAVAMAHGITSHARSENSCLLRRTKDERELYKVDLTRIASGEEPDTRVVPGDVIIVGTSWPIRSVDGIIGAGRLVPIPAVP